MISRFAIPGGSERAGMEKAFDALLKLDALRHRVDAETAVPRPVPLSRLYDYASDIRRDNDAWLERALAGDPRLAADLRLLLGQTAIRHLPRAAAASSGPVRERHGEGCRVRLQPSRAEPGQTYVIIEMIPGGEPAPAPRAFFVCDAGNNCRRYTLPEARDGIVQLLAEARSDLVRALEDIRTEIYLR